MKPVYLSFVFLLLAISGPVAGETAIYEITIKNHRFHPDTLTIPAGRKARLRVTNEDPTPEEFESYELAREKIVPGNSQVIIFIDALDPGEYPFFGEFNMDTAQGRIIAE